jgi:dipeptidyl aminopeptidase/acylaminoacyl peptidase
MRFHFSWLTLLVALFVAIGSGVRAAPLEAYGKLPQTETVAMSPNGELVGLVKTEGEQRILVIQRGEEKPIFMGDISDLKLAGVEWAGNDYVVFYLHKTDRLNIDFRSDEEFLQAIVVNLSTGKARALFDIPRSYISAVFGRYGYVQHDGEWWAYVGLIPLVENKDPTKVGTFKQNYPNLYRVSLKSGSVIQVAPGGSNGRHWVLNEQGEIIARSDYDLDDGRWQVFAGKDGQQPVASGQVPFGFCMTGRGRTPGTVLIERGGDDDKIVEISLDTGKQEELLDTNASLLRTGPNHPLIGTVEYGERDKVSIYDSVLEKRVRSIEKAFGDARLRVEGVSEDRSRILVYVEDRDIAGTWQLVDFNTKKSAPIADAYPGLAEKDIGEIKVVEYTAADGLAMNGILTLPPKRAAKDLPLIVLPHGGPESMSRVHFDWWAQAFASRGYAVFQPNFRGSINNGIEFRNAGFGQYGRKMQSDISDGVAALAKAGTIDPKRVCIAGGSYGGYAALAGVTLQHGLYRCAASYAGVSDPASRLSRYIYVYGPKGAGPRYLRAFLGVEKGEAVPDEISPRAQAKKADAPVLLIHGTDDTVVEVSQSKSMYDALKSAGKPVEYVSLKSEDHWLSRSQTRLQMLQAMVTFVEKHNPPM